MKFEVTRTSQGSRSEEPPCPEARSEQRPFRADVRTCPTPEDFDERKLTPGPWLAHGTNHRTVALHDGKQGIARDLPVDELRWVVDMADLDALVRFVSQYGEVVIDARPYEGDIPSLEIYDTYRE